MQNIFSPTQKRPESKGPLLGKEESTMCFMRREVKKGGVTLPFNKYGITRRILQKKNIKKIKKN